MCDDTVQAHTSMAAGLAFQRRESKYEKREFKEEIVVVMIDNVILNCDKV